MDYPSNKTSMLIISFISLVLLADAVASSRNIHIVHHSLRSELRSDLLEFCQKTTNPALCARTIQPHFLHRGLDRFKALEIEVEATLNQTKKTAAIISELLAKHDISKSLKGSLDTCKEQYDSIMDAIKDTFDAIARRDIVEAKFKFSAVLSFQSSCKDAFEGLDDDPIASDSDTMFQLGGNCLDIIADMEKVLPHRDAPVELTPSAFSSVIGTVS